MGEGIVVCGLCRFSVGISAAEFITFFSFRMPKRSCPFTDSFSTQYKIHVGQKELNLHGVFGNKYRQEVYGKGILVSHIFNTIVGLNTLVLFSIVVVVI